LVLPDSPISSVNPAADWAGGNATGVSTTAAPGAVTIVAKGSVPSAPGESFDSWLQFGNGTIAGSSITVPNGGSSLAIASYRVPDKPIFRVPLDLVNELANLIDRINPGDPSPGDLVRLAGNIALQTGSREMEADELTTALAQIDKLNAT